MDLTLTPVLGVQMRMLCLCNGSKLIKQEFPQANELKTFRINNVLSC